MIVSCNRISEINIIRYSVAASTVALMCASIVWQMEAIPSVSDIRSFRTVVVLALLVLVSMCLWKRLPRFHWMDCVVLFWWCSVSLNYIFRSPYPAEEVYNKATALTVAYVCLRLIVSGCGANLLARFWLIGLCAAGGYELWKGMEQLIGCEASRHPLFDLTGTFFNPGPYAIFVAVVLAVTGAWWYRNRSDFAEWTIWRKIVTWCTATVAFFCFPILVGTWSRAAWVAVAVFAVCLLWQAHRRMVLKGICVVACAGVAVYFLKQDSADGRLLMMVVAARAWSVEWLLGHGIGGYAHAYGEAQEAFFATHADSPWVDVAGTPEYAFNGLLGIGVEQGLVGMLLALVLGLWSLFVLLRCGEVSAYGWLVLLVSSLFSYSFALWPFLSMAVTWIALAVSIEAGTVEVRWWRRIGVLPVVAAGGLCVWNMSVCTARTVEAYREFRRVQGIQDVAFIEDYRKKQELLKAYPDFLFTFSRALRENGDYNESNAMLNRGTMVSCDPVFYTLMGNNYRDLGAMEEAETAYRKAFGMLPGRMYPLYRLMKLYEAEEEWQKAETVARKIIVFNPKVDSPAVREMKDEAEKLIGK